MASISYDWKQRLKKDTQDFISNISDGFYDFEIIYNAYPERENGDIPSRVISFVAEELCKSIKKDPHQYDDFLLYIQKEKGQNGRKIFNYIFKRLIKKYPEQYINMVKDILKDSEDKKEITKLFSKVIYPLVKKYPKYIDRLFHWIREENDLVIENIFRTLAKYIKINKDSAEKIFKKSESFWNSHHDSVRAGNAKLLEALYIVDRELYKEIYDDYSNTHNPNFVEILSNGVKGYNSDIEEIMTKWSKSGNSRIKKSAKQALKKLRREAKKQ